MHITMFLHDGSKVIQVVTSGDNKAALEKVGFADSADKAKPKRLKKAKVVSDDHTSKD